MKVKGPLTEEQKRAIRKILTGQEDEPVELMTSTYSGDKTGSGPMGHDDVGHDHHNHVQSKQGGAMTQQQEMTEEGYKNQMLRQRMAKLVSEYEEEMADAMVQIQLRNQRIQQLEAELSELKADAEDGDE